MRLSYWVGLMGLVGVTLVAAPVHAQGMGTMRMGMGRGMGMMGMGRGMGMGHDSMEMTRMLAVHELVMGHDRITRTVTVLRDGIRTTTESDDPGLSRLLQEHVAGMDRGAGDSSRQALPMESPALRTILRNMDKIHTTREITAKGIAVVQTSNDSATVVALQKHAAEVTDLVQRGMAAMHDAMMQRMGGMTGMTGRGGMGGMDKMVVPTTTDTGFTALQQRGKQAMGVDQYTSTHHFDPQPDGGRIELQRDVDDAAGVAQIRQHLQEIARAFAKGDFSIPGFVHMQEVPGTKGMAARQAAIAYYYRELPRGGEVRIISKDPAAVTAIHEFLLFQQQDHHAH